MIFKFTLKNIQVNNHVTTFVFNNDNNNNSHSEASNAYSLLCV